jgi:dihydroorotate dehydrogenase
MSWAYRTLLRPLLFRQDSERIHEFTIRRLAFVGRHPALCAVLRTFLAPKPLPVELFGLHFPNPIGLAAGMDKNADAAPVWPALGFGFSELGAVTWLPQSGNPAPRVFRAIADQGLINRMGFNNMGAEAMALRLAKWRSVGLWPDHPVGINLGKSKLTPLADAATDYASSLRVLWPQADFFVVNVSSPNTPNLRQLQDRAALDEILAALQEVNHAAAARSSVPAPAPKPILVKVAPDLEFSALDDILQLTETRRVAGLIATNTTITRPETNNRRLRQIYSETGGLSGRPLTARSTEIIRHLHRQTRGRLPIIGVGGIFNAADAWEKIEAGASLLQIYTGLVFEGPGVAREIVSGLHARLAKHGLARLADAVGYAPDRGPNTGGMTGGG